MSRTVALTEREYERAFIHWQYTPAWRLLARARRKREWKLWLDAMGAEIQREAS